MLCVIPAMPLQFSSNYLLHHLLKTLCPTEIPLLKQHVVYHKTTRCLLQNKPLFTTKRHVVYHETRRRFDKIHPPRSPAHPSLTIGNNYWFYQGFLSRARTHNKSFYFFSVTSVTTHHINHSVSGSKSISQDIFNNYPSIQLFRGIFTFRSALFSHNFVLAFSPIFPHRVTLVTAKK